ncbi:hypothetical protein AB0B09_23005, partial [Streptomyces sp. NPDC044948]
MPSIARPSVLGEPLDPLPKKFAAFMRPLLPGLLNEIRTEVTRTYPVYGRLLNGPDGDAIRQGVEQALTAFVDRVDAEHDPLTDLPNRALFTRRVQQALSGRRA